MSFRLLSLLVVAALAGCGGETETVKEVPVQSDSEHITISHPESAGFLKLAEVRREHSGPLRLPGRLTWDEDHTVRVFPQLGGRVVRSLVETGTTVKAGQPLALLASPDFGQARAEAKRAEADLALARQSLARNRELFDAGVVARKELQQAQAEAARADAESDRALRRLAQLGGDGDGSYVLKSPLAGIVVERNLNPGQEFRPDQAGAPLFVVTNPSRLWVQIDAAEGDLAVLKAGAPLQLEVKQYPGERFAGVVRHVADFVDPVSRTVKVRGEVPNPERRLKGEMFVSAQVETPANPVLRVPTPAVFLMGDTRYVFVEEAPGRYRRQAVQVGADRDGWTTVDSGLAEGNRVIVEGNLHLLKYFKAAATPAPAAK